MATTPPFKTTVPGLESDESGRAVEIMQERLSTLIDLHLTLKHIHWNVIGMNFIAVHRMLDPQVDAVRAMTDELAERIATMGGEPLGTPGSVVRIRSWDDYELNREPAVRHLSALDSVYSGVIEDHRAATKKIGEIDPVTEDLFIGQLRQLELFQWFIRAHLKDSSGDVVFRDSGAPESDDVKAARERTSALTNSTHG
ncbi:MAG: DNA starvation/stationary phase protection protein [Actinobacteria bacterium]|nr:DNA starvation/stationary phase protection protein [Actinomycetota bacterium]